MLANSETKARLRADSKLPTISLLVAAWNEEKYIIQFLKSYIALDYPYKELILNIPIWNLFKLMLADSLAVLHSWIS